MSERPRCWRIAGSCSSTNFRQSPHTIDPEARFKFVSGKGYRAKEGELRFDMFEAEFTHEGDKCTFEVLLDHVASRTPRFAPSPRSSMISISRTASSGEPKWQGFEP